MNAIEKLMIESKAVGECHRSSVRPEEVATTVVDRYLTVADAARLLGVCDRTVYEALRNGRLLGQKFGRVWRVKSRWIEEWGIANRRIREVRDAL